MNDADRTPYAMHWTLLIVDDEAPVRQVLRDILARGFPNATILDAPEPVSALAMLKDEDVDLILSDQRMPIMDGVTFLTKAAAARPDAMRVLLTGYADWETAQRAVNEGHVQSLLQKPIEGPALVAEIRKLLEIGRIHRNQTTALERARKLASLPRATPPPFTGDLGGG